MKIYYISIHEKYYQNTDHILCYDLYTKTELDGRFYLKKKKAIKIAKNLFEELSKKEEYQQEYTNFIQNEDEGRFSLKTVEGNFLSIFVNELVG